MKCFKLVWSNEQKERRKTKIMNSLLLLAMHVLSKPFLKGEEI